MVFNDVDGLYTYTFEAERKVCRAFVWRFGLTRFKRRNKNQLYCFFSGKLFSLQPGASGPPVSSFSQAAGGSRVPY